MSINCITYPMSSYLQLTYIFLDISGQPFLAIRWLFFAVFVLLPIKKDIPYPSQFFVKAEPPIKQTLQASNPGSMGHILRGSSLMPVYGNFGGISLRNSVWVGNIMSPVFQRSNFLASDSIPKFFFPDLDFWIYRILWIFNPSMLWNWGGGAT